MKLEKVCRKQPYALKRTSKQVNTYIQLGVIPNRELMYKKKVIDIACVAPNQHNMTQNKFYNWKEKTRFLIVYSILNKNLFSISSVSVQTLVSHILG